MKMYALPIKTSLLLFYFYDSCIFLDLSGKNDGSVAGKHYFQCNPGYGVLVRPDRVTRGGAKRHRQQQQQQQKRRSANLSGSSPNLAALTALAKGEGGTGSTSRSRGENRKSWNT